MVFELWAAAAMAAALSAYLVWVLLHPDRF